MKYCTRATGIKRGSVRDAHFRQRKLSSWKAVVSPEGVFNKKVLLTSRRWSRFYFFPNLPGSPHQGHTSGFNARGPAGAFRNFYDSILSRSDGGGGRQVGFLLTHWVSAGETPKGFKNLYFSRGEIYLRELRNFCFPKSCETELGKRPSSCAETCSDRAVIALREISLPAKF